MVIKTTTKTQEITSKVMNPFKKDKVDEKDYPLLKEMNYDPTPFHDSIKTNQTEFVELKNLAKSLGLKNIFCKDESSRYGLKSFKGLGGSFALHKQIEALKKKNPNLNPKDYVFCAATDGNHGKGLAWASTKLGLKSEIYLPGFTSKERAKAIKGQGANVIQFEELNYDETMRHCFEKAKKNPNYIAINDTSADNYYDIPSWIMCGYKGLFFEIFKNQLSKIEDFPTHVLLQTGVGGFACAASYFFKFDLPKLLPSLKLFKDKKTPKTPTLIGVQPVSCDAYCRSFAEGKNGEILFSLGNGNSIMQGLNCAEPSEIAFHLIKDTYDMYMSIDDEYCKKAMNTYYYPKDGDKRIISGESGACTMGGLLDLLKDKEMCKKCGIDKNSVVLLISTEGDTDPVSFKKIVSKEQ